MSPNNIRIEKQDIVINEASQEDDASAMSFSHKKVEMENIRSALAQTIKECEKGKDISRGILEEVDPRVLEMIRSEEK